MKLGNQLANFAQRVDFKVLQVGRLAKHALVDGSIVDKVQVHQVYVPFVPTEQQARQVPPSARSNATT